MSDFGPTEDVATGDLGGGLTKVGHTSSSDSSTGFAFWTAELSSARVLTEPVCRTHDLDGRQGMGLWRAPADPFIPTIDNDSM